MEPTLPPVISHTGTDTACAASRLDRVRERPDAGQEEQACQRAQQHPASKEEPSW